MFEHYYFLQTASEKNVIILLKCVKKMHHFCERTHLLVAEFPLDLLAVAGVVDDGPGELGLDVRQPGTQAAHVFVQLLHRHQGLPQLFHPGGKKTHEPKQDETFRMIRVNTPNNLFKKKALGDFLTTIYTRLATIMRP